MKILTNVLLGILVLIVAYSVFFEAHVAFGSSTGTTYNVEKQAATVISLASPGANGTSTSILNTDVSNRYVSSWKVGCNNVGTSLTAYTGAGLASLQVTVATSSTATPGTLTGWADVANAQAISTSTTQLLVASSTLQSATSSLPTIWHPGEYMTFSFNATNTAACTVGVNYFGA